MDLCCQTVAYLMKGNGSHMRDFSSRYSVADASGKGAQDLRHQGLNSLLRGGFENDLCV